MTQKSLKLSDALTFAIKDLKKPLLSDFEIGKLLFNLYLEKNYTGHPLKIRKNFPDRQDYSRIIKSLMDHNILKSSRLLKYQPFFETVGGHKLTNQEIICSVDPFSYISHNSAMYFHNLISEEPFQIYFTSPSQHVWKSLAIKKMDQELKGHFVQYKSCNLPLLRRYAIPRLKGSLPHRYSTKHIGQFVFSNYNRLRISTIGRTFLDMLRKPDLCGGIKNVIIVFISNAKKYIDEILYEIDAYGSKIERVRAGFIFEELCKLQNPIINSWEQYAQRGGSQKLDSSNKYSPIFSEKWCLSINVELNPSSNS